MVEQQVRAVLKRGKATCRRDGMNLTINGDCGAFVGVRNLMKLSLGRIALAVLVTRRAVFRRLTGMKFSRDLCLRVNRIGQLNPWRKS